MELYLDAVDAQPQRAGWHMHLHHIATSLVE